MILLLNSLLSNISDSSTDEEVIEKYLATQNSAYFDILYKRYSNKVFARSISLLKDRDLAQDAVQDVFIKILTNLSKFGGKSKFSSWLYSITYNHCIDFMRRKKKANYISMEDVLEIKAEASDIEDKLLLEVKYSQMKVIMDELPTKDKSVLLMKYLDGMSIKEICVLTDKTESAVKMQIKRAKEKFLYLRNNLFPSEL